MKTNFIESVIMAMKNSLDSYQIKKLRTVLKKELTLVDMTPIISSKEQCNKENEQLLSMFLSSKKVEGCSEKTLKYYSSTIKKLLDNLKCYVCNIEASEIRKYLSEYQERRKSSKVTIDNMRRIFSSFFVWLENEDYIAKSPVRKIHKVKTDVIVKETITDEELEILRDNCSEPRDLALVDFLVSTGVRVGELVKINITDLDLNERQCVVLGKGSKEREVYFNARTKIHLQSYLQTREDDNPALFVSLSKPHNRLTISGVETRIRSIGRVLNMPKLHPHKFRRTLATMAIDRGMPIEQVQKLLGHVKIDTTLHYAMVNQTNVKIAHRKFIG